MICIAGTVRGRPTNVTQYGPTNVYDADTGQGTILCRGVPFIACIYDLCLI